VGGVSRGEWRAIGAGDARPDRSLSPHRPNDRGGFEIGCRILTQPFFFEERDWISVPRSWSPNIVSFKTYTTSDADGLSLWKAVNDRLSQTSFLGMAEDPQARYGERRLIRPRLGQGAFRVLVTDTYKRRCAITQERTLPALEAAHIRPYGIGGEHETRNGLPFRRDIHSLFDAGYVTVTPDLPFEVSRRIKEEFENGRHYYELHGKPIYSSNDAVQRPDPEALRWHNEHAYRG
jgi:putative restriction endonuclease